MAAAKKKTYKYDGDSRNIKAEIWVEVEIESWDYLEGWLNNAPSCGEDYGISVLKIEAQEV